MRPDRREQGVLAKSLRAGPVVATWQDHNRADSGRLDDRPQGLIRVQPDDHIVVIGHVRGVLLLACRYPPQRPAPGVYHLADHVVTLAQHPREHALTTGDVSHIASRREPVGDKRGDHLEPGRIAVEAVTTHACKHLTSARNRLRCASAAVCASGPIVGAAGQGGGGATDSVA